VYVSLDDTLQLSLDCVAMLSPRRGVAFGWAMAPRGAAIELSVATPEGECPIRHCSFHPRRDVPAVPQEAAISGFTLVFDQPVEPDALELTLGAGPLLLRADMRDRRLETDLCKATLDRAPEINFALMQAAAGDPVLGSLLRHGGRPFGVFADWIATLPLLRNRAQEIGGLSETEALATAAGEALVMLRGASALDSEATIDALAIGWLRDADGIAEPMVLPLADRHATRLPAALAFYARIESAVLERLHALELILRAEPRPGEETWLRCQPASATVPELLDAASRGTAASLALPSQAATTPGLDLLRQVIAHREAAFAPTLAALAAPQPMAEPAATTLPRLALILGADDPAAARLFHVTAQLFESRCDSVLVMGSAAEEVVQAFVRRGRLEVLAGPDATQTLREAAGRAGILVLEAAAFADAVISGTPERAFAQPLEAADLARLLALHTVAGCAPSLADSLQRLVRARRAGTQPFAPVRQSWANRHAAELANAHLERLWAIGATLPHAARPEAALHA
jgi:hypothetical protein